VPPSGFARGEPDRRDHRQPERQERGKRGPAIDPAGDDAGKKKIKGKKRHILVDTQGLLMHAIVHAADVQDRDGGAMLMAGLFGAFPFLIKLYADGGYQGPEFQSAMKRILARLTVEIVKRSGQATGFIALPKRWIVERTFAWLGRCRRLAKDWECLNHRALAFLRLASIRLMLRKLCNPSRCSRRDSQASQRCSNA
jgi:transposase